MRTKKQIALFVDDEPFLQEALFAVLEAEGITCVSTSSVSEAMAYLHKNEEVSVIVTDIMMPSGESYKNIDSSMAGFFFVDEVLKKFPKIPMICLSVIGDQRKINQLKKKGVLYLRKGETPLDTAIDLIKSKIRGFVRF